MTIAEFFYTVILKPPLLRRGVNSIIKALLTKTVRVGNATIWINPNDPVVSGALLFRVYERNEIAFFRSHFEPTMTFIDVGANVGLYTGIALSTEDFQGKILALEPHEESRFFLQKTIQSNKAAELPSNVITSELAASDCPGMLKLYKNSQNKGDNRIYPDPLLEGEEIIATDMLDNICQRHDIQSVHFLKIDVQGAEAKVIKGARKLIENSPDCILMSEFWPYGLNQCDSDAAAYLEQLNQLGFTLYELGRRLIPIDDLQALIARTQGRNYVNLVGLKGKFKNIASPQQAPL